MNFIQQNNNGGYTAYILNGDYLETILLSENHVDSFIDTFGEKVPTITEYQIWSRKIKN